MITLTIGIPASGKSTWAKKFIQDNPNTVRICRDDFRAMLNGSQIMNKEGEALVTTLVESAIRQAVASGYDVVVDQTNCNERFLRKLTDFCVSLDDTNFRVFPISLAEAKFRNSKREAEVPNEVIERMFGSFGKLAESFDMGLRPKTILPQYVNDPYLQSAIIFDVDGTLALMHDRGPFDWAKVGQDKVNVAVREAYQTFHEAGYHMIVLSGRDAICKEATVKWLTDNSIFYSELHMRAAGDSRPDTVIKKEIFETHIRDRYNVIGVFDDRKGVKRMWVNLGLFVFDCNQLDLEF